MAGEQFRVTEGNALGEQVSVAADMLIGRAAPEPDGRLGDDPEISRRHARAWRGTEGELRIEDLGSANGTFVNGERIEDTRTLHVGDVVRMGQTVLEVTDASGRTPQPTQLSSKPPADLQLVVTVGADQGQLLTLGDEFTIGRAESGDGRLGDDPELSRRHARLTRGTGGQLTIEDLGSANGTWVNGIVIREPQALEEGDSVRVGKTTLEVVDPAKPARAERPAAAPAPSPPPAAAPPPPAAAPPPPAAAPPPPAAAPPPPAAAPPPAPPRPSPAPVARPVPAPTAPPRDTLPSGTVFAGCRVEAVIGHGDMGVVYKAEELALQRPVALKLILPDFSGDARFRERFRRESMVAASIDHPNVIPILDAGDESGVLYISMRLVEGTDLRALIAQEGQVDPLRAARIVRQVGGALDAAHAHGLVHRDVKPANVLLGRADHVYLSDFGLAKRAEEAGGLTRQGSIVARAEYVAPEQLLEDRVDALTDVYALGCLLFEALTGEPPFVGSKEGPAMLAHVNAPPPSPLERVPGLPPQFDEVVRRAMAKEPGQRFPSAGDLGEAALMAAGDSRRVGAESVVATGAAAPYDAMPGLSRAPMSDPEPAQALAAAGPGDRANPLQWGFALAVLAILAVCMFAALNALSNL
jgi:pSer/pThr/pTyr-binding forkhead associated (FHA) protein/tRNA A-37 threonylcarbamoyl transferase component Bud32